MTRDCWKDFAVSGRVSDYLKYREQECRKERQAAWMDGVRDGAEGCPGRHGAGGDACR